MCRQRLHARRVILDAVAIIVAVAFAGAGPASGGVYRMLPDAPQLIYQHGVPHTDRHGSLRTEPDAASFFPRCGYATLAEALPGLKNGGFNCFMPWNGLSLDEVLSEAERSGLQLVKELLIAPCNFSAQPDCDPQLNAAPQIARIVGDVAAHAQDRGILAWYLEEEITGCSYPSSNCPERVANYRQLEAAIRQVDSVHPSFNLELSMPAQKVPAWVSELNSSGDIAVNDDYPFNRGDETSLEASVTNTSRLVVLNREAKPVWITVQTFEQPSTRGPAWRMPTPVQLRAQVFASIIHGATGILYFASDGWVVRNAQVIGIAASTPSRYPDDRPTDIIASASQIAASQALWNGTVRLNGELQRLQSAILSPTSRLAYTVSVAGRAFTATPVRTLLKESGGRYTLLAVNIDDAPLALRIALPRPAIELLSINADGVAVPLAADGQAIEDSIESFGVRIYQFR